MSSPVITADEVINLLGETEPFIVERILDTGASFDEVAEALSAIEDEDANGELPHEPSSPRVFEVRRVLEELVMNEDTDQEELWPPS